MPRRMKNSNKKRRKKNRNRNMKKDIQSKSVDCFFFLLLLLFDTRTARTYIGNERASHRHLSIHIGTKRLRIAEDWPNVKIWKKKPNRPKQKYTHRERRRRRTGFVVSLSSLVACMSARAPVCIAFVCRRALRTHSFALSAGCYPIRRDDCTVCVKEKTDMDPCNSNSNPTTIQCRLAGTRERKRYWFEIELAQTTTNTEYGIGEMEKLAKHNAKRIRKREL